GRRYPLAGGPRGAASGATRGSAPAIGHGRDTAPAEAPSGGSARRGLDRRGAARGRARRRQPPAGPRTRERRAGARGPTARDAPAGAAVVLEVPLLPGESVTTPEVRVAEGKALVSMGPSASEVGWHSILPERPSLALVAPPALVWTEVWRLDVSPIWHVEVEG